MNGIDTAVATALATRVDSLLSVGPRADVATSQAGASALSVDTPVANGGLQPVTPSAPQASAQTALSAVALTLDAIARSGGEATPAVVGLVPVWPAAPALDVEIVSVPLPLFDTPAAPASASTAGSPQGNTAAAASGTMAASVVAPSPLPVAALAAALQHTVAESGLFYEAHLAQWLSGQRTPASLAGEPQNRLSDAAAQLPLEWAADTDGATQPWSSAYGMAAQARGMGPANLNQAMPAGGNAAARGAPDGPLTQAARFAAFDASETGGLPDSAQSMRTLHASVGDASGANAADAPQQQLAAAIHPATIPLVRQQLDLLATGQFRWTGEAWPGARLDWTIEQEGDEWHRGGSGAETDDQYPWRTRLTLSLPSLGTVDAELTLSGMQLIARVQANPEGAARLAAQGELFRQRLATAGITLSALSIREIGGGAPVSDPAAAASAAQANAAYARSAAAGDDISRNSARARAKTARPEAAAGDDYDWDIS